MKKALITFILILNYLSFAQIGINTNNPNAMLDIDGDLSIRGKIYAGGTEGTLGDPGVAGQVLVSQGPGLPPKWLTLNIPEIEQNYYLIYNNTYEDRTGASFTSSQNSGNNLYTRGTSLSSLSSWKKIPDLTQTFEVHSTNNKTYFTFETVAQIATTGSNNLLDAVEFACGIFIDGKLEGVRVNTVEQPSSAYGPFRTITMLQIAENLSVGTHAIDVACTRRQSYSTSVALGIGRAVESENLNNFMAKSTLKVEVYEIPDTYVDVDP
ncbi:MAG TPA: hypothetical protein VKY36_02220 [Moheibacter sp.]|nr:hypothetical protein [Moheibacter sp.]